MDAHRPRGRLIVAGLLVLIGLVGLVNVGRAQLSPTHQPGRENAHVRSLARALDAGAGPQMQALFPEGEFFSWTLTGLAAARLAGDGVQRDDNLAVSTAALAAISSPRVAGHFGDAHPGVPHGAFYHGWRLQLLVAQAKATQDARDLAVVEAEAVALLAALDTPGAPPLTSYPGQAWPCDLVVAWSAVHLADELQPVVGLDAATDRWRDQVAGWRDPATGLIGHHFGAGGATVSGARGSSQAIINTFLRDIDPHLADAEWAGFTARFVQRSYGLVGIREYPAGITSGTGDVDSGPLIDGISLSASAVTLGAARANADPALATRLSRQAELVAAPLPWLGGRGLNGRVFAFAVMPVGDAFVVAARTQPVGSTASSTDPQYPAVLWAPWWLLAALPLGAGLLLGVRSVRLRRPAVPA